MMNSFKIGTCLPSKQLLSLSSFALVCSVVLVLLLCSWTDVFLSSPHPPNPSLSLLLPLHSHNGLLIPPSITYQPSLAKCIGHLLTLSLSVCLEDTSVKKPLYIQWGDLETCLAPHVCPLSAKFPILYIQSSNVS